MSPVAPPRVVVVGAGGFVGRAVGSALERAGTIVETSRDLSEVEPLGAGATVINCAGAIRGDAEQLAMANVRLAGTVAARAVAGGARLIHLSSMGVFDAIPSGALTDERTPAARSLYGQSKLRGEAAVAAAAPDAIIVRPSRIVGGEDPRERLHSLVRHVRAGRPLPDGPEGEIWANFVSADELADVIAGFVLDPASRTGPVHVSSTVSWSRFLGLLGDAVGRPVRRLPAAAGRLWGLAAGLGQWIPVERRPRLGSRLLEAWDRQRMIDSGPERGEDRLRAALEEIARRAV